MGLGTAAVGTGQRSLECRLGLGWRFRLLGLRLAFASVSGDGTGTTSRWDAAFLVVVAGREGWLFAGGNI